MSGTLSTRPASSVTPAVGEAARTLPARTFAETCLQCSAIPGNAPVYHEPVAGVLKKLAIGLDHLREWQLDGANEYKHGRYSDRKEFGCLSKDGLKYSVDRPSRRGLHEPSLHMTLLR